MKYTLIFFSIALLFFSCNDQESEQVEFSSETQVTDLQGNTYEVGYNQVSPDNQNPFVRKTDSEGMVKWSIMHEATAIDCKATMIALDNQDRPYVIFTLDGGSTESSYITQKFADAQAFSGVPFSGYGRAEGAAKISVLARLEPETGQIEKATFLMARTAQGDANATGKTNSFEVVKIGLKPESVVVQAHSWYKPPAKEATQGNFVFHPQATDEAKHGNPYWTMEYELPLDLSQLSGADVK